MDSAMYQDPSLELGETELRFPSDVLPLWITALSSPEADLRCQAATTIAWAGRRGMQGLQDAIDPLTENLAADHDLVRLASADALIALDARRAAEALFGLVQTNRLELVQLIEPVLGEWNFEPMIDQWRERVADPQVDRRRKLLAIRGLGAVNDSSSAAELRRIAADVGQLPDLRLAAGESLGRISQEGLEDLAAELIGRAAPTGPLERLVAVRLLRWHSSPSAQKLLIELAQDDESGVAVVALRRLEELEPDLILPFAEASLAGGDANVRRVVAQALIARPVDTSLVMLGDLLDDPIPDLRLFVRQSLEELAESADLRERIIAQGERLLAADSWQGLEQSIKLLVHLNHTATTNRFLELLKHPRWEVYVTAAWALRKSAVDETLEPLLEFAEARNRQRVELMAQGVYRFALDEQLSQILQFFGQKRYTPAEPFLLTFIPKNFELHEARGAAIWSLGWLHEDQPDPKLVKSLTGRLTDVSSMVVEEDLIRRFSAIGLGRMKAREALPELKLYYEPDGIYSEVGYACCWAIREITGQEFKPPVRLIRFHSDFFLQPLKTRP
jgi:HEAT repeat protein